MVEFLAACALLMFGGIVGWCVGFWMCAQVRAEEVARILRRDREDDE